VWDRWLAAHSTAKRVAPPALGAPQYPPVDDAPGEYVRQK
jgi:polyhydroxyalkanoate synthase